ncbi:hypothetical protein MMPV_002387 [Pyropia vietnamensis]
MAGSGGSAPLWNWNSSCVPTSGGLVDPYRYTSDVAPAAAAPRALEEPRFRDHGPPLPPPGVGGTPAGIGSGGGIGGGSGSGGGGGGGLPGVALGGGSGIGGGASGLEAAKKLAARYGVGSPTVAPTGGGSSGVSHGNAEGEEEDDEDIEVEDVPRSGGGGWGARGAPRH